MLPDKVILPGQYCKSGPFRSRRRFHADLLELLEMPAEPGEKDVAAVIEARNAGSLDGALLVLQADKGQGQGDVVVFVAGGREPQ